MDIDLEYTPILEPLPQLAMAEEVADLRSKLAASRVDIDLLCGWLDAVLNGMTPQELAQLANVREEVAQRWGLEDGAVQP